MSKIRVLPETVQNKIAAGEVIERPASVVKELVENALDAGATRIAVELEDGGHRLIRVSDNGGGMDEDDLVHSLQRHATSKIRDVDDIFRIATFGFRGEALPSIGSVSRMRMITCLPGAGEGREIVVEAGRSVRLGPAAPRQGTTVEVRDIFFNTPARRKFLRTPPAEATRASEVLTRLALGNPGVGFRLQSGERIILAVHPADAQLDRIRDLFGKKIADDMIPFAADITEGLSVSGYFVRPPSSRKNSRDIFILVNRRWIRHYGLARAVADAFQGVLPPREYPFAVINLAVDPARVDVNAHPTKEEVRFEQDKLLLAGVRRAVREALGGMAGRSTFASLDAPFGATVAEAPATETSATAAPATETPETETPEADRRLRPPRHGPGTAGAPPPGASAPAFGRARAADFSGFDLNAARERLRGPNPDFSPGQRGTPPDGDSNNDNRNAAVSDSEPPSSGRLLSRAGTYRILGQAGGKYILVDGPDGLLLVDPHALHERWNFDRLKEERSRGGRAVRLLVPVEMDLSPPEAAAAVEAVPALAEYGFEFSLPKPNRMVVRAAPSYIRSAKLENLLRQVLADVGDAGMTLEAARERLLASLACRSSVLLNHSLPEEEMLALLERFFHHGQLPTCPHGRPTAIKLTWEELGRRFGR